MAHVRSVATQNLVEIDDGVVLRPNSFVNVDITRPLAAAALIAKTIETLDAVAPPPPLASNTELRFTTVSLEGAEKPLLAGQFDFWLDQTPGATKLHISAKDSEGTIRRAEIALA
jgi:hypothetical protein